VRLVEHDERIQTFPPDRTNQPLNVGTLPRGRCGGQHLLEVEVVDPVAAVPTIDPLAVPKNMARRGVLGKGLYDLLGGPLGTGIRGHVEVHDSSTIV